MSSIAMDDIEMKDASTTVPSVPASTQPTTTANESKEDSRMDVDDDTTTEHKSATKDSSSAAASSSSSSSSKKRSNEELKGASASGGDSEGEELFVAFPPPLFADKANIEAVTKPLRLPVNWTKAVEKSPAKSAKPPAKKLKGEDGKSSPVAKEKLTKTEKEKEAEKERKRKEKEKEKLKEKEQYDRLIPEPGMTVQESFEKLVKEILYEGKSAPATNLGQQEMVAYRAWEIPYMSHFSWLFQKPLSMRPIEPYRLEQILCQPNNVLNEATFSEFASKLLFATRINYSNHYKKSMAFMGRNQRCFQYELISEWMFWLVELWIEQWKALKKREAEERLKQEQQNEDGEGGDGEGEDENEEQTNTSTRKRAPKKTGRKTPAADADDSDLSDEENEAEEEKEAYNLHQIPERKWRVDTEALFNNINPFCGDAPASSSTDSAAAAASQAAPSAVASSSTPTPAAPVLPLRRKSFHEISLNHRVTILKLLCDYQLHCNPFFIEKERETEGTNLRIEPLGSDATGKKYYHFGFPDFRIYVQGTIEWIKKPKSDAELKAEKDEEEEFKREVERTFQKLKAEAKEKEKAAKAKEKAEKEERQKLKEEKKEKKKITETAMNMDEDAPLSLLVAPPPQPTAPATTERTLLNFFPVAPSTSTTETAAASSATAAPSSLSALPSPNTSTTATNSSSATVASSSEPSPGLPFTLLTPEQSAAAYAPREITFTMPPAPAFSLLTNNAAQLRALIARVKTSDHPRNIELTRRLKRVLEDIEEGRGRAIEEEEKKSEKSGKKELAAPKRVSDRLVTLEAAREEAERARLIRAEEEGRARYTRRNRWLDQMSQRNIAKVKRSYERMMGIEHEKKVKEQDGTESSSSSSSDSATDDEDFDHTRSSSRTRGRKAKTNGHGRNTRNRGKSTKNLAEESETETEDEEEEEAMVIDSDDEGCSICGTIVPPADGSNPILLCDKCDKQLCMRCVPLEKVPSGKFFCNECVAKYPRLR